MATVILHAHGGFDQRSKDRAPEVLVPPGTTLRFFSDAGQPLTLPGEENQTDYRAVVDVWQHFREDEKPLGPRAVTYNFELSPLTRMKDHHAAQRLEWGAEFVSLAPGDQAVPLCDGFEGMCPTPALLLQQHRFDKYGEGEPVRADRWEHRCNGLLAQHAGKDIIWLACTSFVYAAPGLGALDTSQAGGPGLDNAATWRPSPDELDRIAAVNRKALDQAAPGDALPIAVGGGVLLVGGGHLDYEADYLRAQPDREDGQLTVVDDGTGARELQVTGIVGGRAVVTQRLQECSTRGVSFS